MERGSYRAKADVKIEYLEGSAPRVFGEHDIAGWDWK